MAPESASSVENSLCALMPKSLVLHIWAAKGWMFSTGIPAWSRKAGGSSFIEQPRQSVRSVPVDKAPIGFKRLLIARIKYGRAIPDQNRAARPGFALEAVAKAIFSGKLFLVKACQRPQIGAAASPLVRTAILQASDAALPLNFGHLRRRAHEVRRLQGFGKGDHVAHGFGPVMIITKRSIPGAMPP